MVQLELTESATIDRIEWGRDRTGTLQGPYPTKYRIEGSLEAGKWSLLANSNDRLPSRRRRAKALPVTTSADIPKRKPSREEKADST